MNWLRNVIGNPHVAVNLCALLAMLIVRRVGAEERTATVDWMASIQSLCVAASLTAAHVHHPHPHPHSER